MQEHQDIWSEPDLIRDGLGYVYKVIPGSGWTDAKVRRCLATWQRGGESGIAVLDKASYTVHGVDVWHARRFESAETAISLLTFEAKRAQLLAAHDHERARSCIEAVVRLESAALQQRRAAAMNGEAVE